MMIYAMQVLTGEERNIVDRLRRAHLVGIVPSRELIERRGGKDRIVERPSFPGYVFLQRDVPIDPADYYAAMGTHGVIRMLGRAEAGRPIPMTTEDVMRLMVVANGGEPIGISRGVQGEHGIRILEGWLMGKLAEVERVEPRQKRATVRVELMGEMRRMDVGLIIEQERKGVL